MAPSSKESHVILHRLRFRSCTGSSKLPCSRFPAQRLGQVKQAKGPSII